MPDRYLREAILDSERFNTLTLDAQAFYYRLISIVDDFGCYDGRPPVIAAAAYRYGRTEALPIIDLQRNDLLVRYTNAAKPFIALLQWGEIMRGRRKFPAPPICNDRAEVRYRGIYGRQPNWRNPPRSDNVSILLGLDGKPVQLQPPEWRRIDGDFAPLDAAITQPDGSTERSDSEAPGTERPSPERSSSSVRRTNAAARGNGSSERPGSERSINVSSSHAVNEQKKAVDVAVASSDLPPPTSIERSELTTTTPTNGKIELLDSGEWRGVSDAQQLRWQEMFADMSIPDQLDRAGAWLLAHPEERAAYQASGTLDAYLIRWLLREARPKAH